MTWRTRFNLWRKERVRAIGPGREVPNAWYVRFTPNFGCAFRWFGRARIRYARHHGLQIVRWYGGTDDNGVPWGRWKVARQLLGKSRVRGEHYVTPGG